MERRNFFVGMSDDTEIVLEAGDEVELSITAVKSPSTLILKIRRKEIKFNNDIYSDSRVYYGA
jgi:hypothetical protein